VIWVPYLAAVAIMLTAAALLKRGCRNAARPFDAPSRRADRLADLTRELPSELLGHDSYAWPPDTTVPPVPPGEQELNTWAAEWERRYQL
jgi:hypothetical protein